MSEVLTYYIPFSHLNIRKLNIINPMAYINCRAFKVVIYTNDYFKSPYLIYAIDQNGRERVIQEGQKLYCHLNADWMERNFYAKTLHSLSDITATVSVCTEIYVKNHNGYDIYYCTDDQCSFFVADYCYRPFTEGKTLEELEDVLDKGVTCMITSNKEFQEQFKHLLQMAVDSWGYGKLVISIPFVCLS